MQQLRDTTYVKFKKNYGSRFLTLVKNKRFNSWESMAHFLNINRSMIFLYLKEKSKLPYASFNKLIGISGINPAEFSYELVPFLKNGIPRVPQKITPDLAEFIGIMLGDGNINKKRTQITIAGGVIDGSYLYRHVPILIKNLFSKEARTVKLKSNGIQCRFSSRKICNYLTKETRLIDISKKNCVIPRQFFKDKILLKSCIRGLMDTDGGLHRHHKNNCQLAFTNKSFELIDSLKLGLKKLGYTPRKSYENRRDIYKIYLFDKDVKRYFEEIGSCNPKNQVKFDRWVNYGYVPLNREIMSCNFY